VVALLRGMRNSAKAVLRLFGRRKERREVTTILVSFMLIPPGAHLSPIATRLGPMLRPSPPIRSATGGEQRRHSARVGDASGAASKDGPILPGMEVLCVDMADAGLQVESGRIYATRRTLDGGQTYETIIRRAMVFRDRVELIAESGRPEDEKIVVSGLTTEPGQPIFALGLVYGIFRGLE